MNDHAVNAPAPRTERARPRDEQERRRRRRAGHVARFVTLTLIAWVTLTCLALSVLPDGEIDVEDPISTEGPVTTGPETLSDDEAAVWLRAGCLEEWDASDEAASVIVRDVGTDVLDEVTLDEAWRLSRRGEAWMVAACPA